MMLVSDTWSPPSWVAMLPQKFSAATTLIFLPDPAAAVVLPEPELFDEVEQPATAARPVRTVRATAGARGGSPGRRGPRRTPGGLGRRPGAPPPAARPGGLVGAGGGAHGAHGGGPALLAARPPQGQQAVPGPRHMTPRPETCRMVACRGC